MRPKPVRVALLAVAALGACGGDDDDAPPPPSPRGDEGVTREGCALAEGAVAEAVGHAVTLDQDETVPGNCIFVAVDQETHAGATVQVADGPASDLDAVVARLARLVGDVEPLADDLVDDANDGFVLQLGAASQVGAVVGDRLVTVTVIDPLLEPDAALELTAGLVEQAFSS
ncbi:MAG: hypothetical protein ACRD0G_10595 [Acidimicrobiales bacterium]